MGELYIFLALYIESILKLSWGLVVEEERVFRGFRRHCSTLTTYQDENEYDSHCFINITIVISATISLHLLYICRYRYERQYEHNCNSHTLAIYCS